MIAGFLLIIYLGHWALVAFVVALSVLGFSEIETLMRVKAHTEQLPASNRLLTWYWFGIVSFFFHGRTIVARFGDSFAADGALSVLPRYHTFISFLGGIVGLVAFVLLLEPGMYKAQFKQLAWTWMALFLAVMQASFWAANTLDGLFWIMLPASLVICNDCMAYVFGFFFGKTPLIQLSPKKTWEGFIGGGVSTIVWGVAFTLFLSQFDQIVCPRKDVWTWPRDCVRHPVFVEQRIHLWQPIVDLAHLFGRELTHIVARPIVLHSVVFALFAAIIAPFGGFFASGFKRAFKLKDFADTIPGHGGVLDRMDCQFLFGTWTAIYVHSFIATHASVPYLSMLFEQLSAGERAEFLAHVGALGVARQ